MEYCEFFEGPEKKLKIILLKPQLGFRDNSDHKWQRITQASGSQILSHIHNHALSAYILSESSLFVWDMGFQMITCGKTNQLKAMPEILRLIRQDNIAYLSYERKSFIFPDKQPSDFEDDVKQLLSYVPGKSYRMGPANGDHLHLFYYINAQAVLPSGAALQILMHDVNPQITELFRQDSWDAPVKTGVTQQLRSILPPETIIDDYRFTPYGYSLNGIYQHSYYTLHITPQEAGSYTSFQTNEVEADGGNIIRAIVSLFAPKKLTIVLKTNTHDLGPGVRRRICHELPDYTMIDHSLHEFDSGYQVVYLHYELF